MALSSSSDLSHHESWLQVLSLNFVKCLVSFCSSLNNPTSSSPICESHSSTSCATLQNSKHFCNLVTWAVMDSSSVRNNPSSQRIYEYDVFISFRGTDTRYNFTDHLYNHLIRKGIFTIIDDKSLEEGQPISSQLLARSKIHEFLSLYSQEIMLPQHGVQMKWLL